MGKLAIVATLFLTACAMEVGEDYDGEAELEELEAFVHDSETASLDHHNNHRAWHIDATRDLEMRQCLRDIARASSRRQALDGPGGHVSHTPNLSAKVNA